MALVLHEAVAPLTRLGEMPVDRFLEAHWQQHPCVLRNVFPGFQPDLDEHDIAGLACEELAESRLVTGRFPGHEWAVRYGPFAEAELMALPDRDWTLLVQDVEKHYPPLQRLMRQFGFLPTWRLDDLMVSVSAPGGSVGPHVDAYDVFLLQASGRRRWAISRAFDPERLPGCDLDVLRHFEAEEAWELNPGDVLYLPPGVAHLGVALETGMTWSIGLRAPSQADLLQALGEWLADRRDGGPRFTDGPGLPAGTGEIDREAVDRLRELMKPPDAIDAFLGAFLTTYRLAHAPAPPQRAMTAGRVAERLQGGAVLRRSPWTRLAWVARGDDATLFAAGQSWHCRRSDAELMCSGDAWHTDSGLIGAATIELITALLNCGHFFIERKRKPRV